MRNAATSITQQPYRTSVFPGQSAIVTGFTVEFALWSLIGIGSFALRVWNLGIAPLTNVESTNALSSLALAHGESISTYNPLFTTLQSLIFSLFSATDFSARLPMAIVGALLCLSPALLRHQMGRKRTLIFSGLLTLSPTLVFASRQAEGALLGWALAFALWCCWQRGSIRAAFIFAGLLLACGIHAVAPVITLLFAFGVNALGVRSSGLPLPYPRTNLLLGGAAFLLASTSLLWRLSGLGDAFNGFAMWPLSLGAASLIGFPRLVIGALVYEPLTLLCAVGGIMLLLLWRRFTVRETGWLVWIVLSLVLLGIDGSRDAVGLAPLVIGSAAYAATTLVSLFESPESEEGYDYPRYAEGVVFALSVIMLVYAYMGLSMYGAQHSNSWLFTALLGLMMVAGIGVIATLTYNAAVAMRGIGLALGLCLLLYTVSTGYALTQTHATNPGEAYIAETGDDGIRDLVRTIQTASTRAYGDPNSIPIQVLDTAPPSLRWALRNQNSLTYVSHAENAPAVLTSINRRPDEGAYAYIGSAFRIVASASLGSIRCASTTNDQLDCTPLARWLTQRTFDERVITRWIFWMRSDIAQKANGQQY